MEKGINSSTLSPTMDICVGVYLFVVAWLSIMGNMLVIVMAYRRWSSLKAPELLSVNLAVTDLCAALSTYPLTMVSAWNHRWLGGDGLCIYYGLMGFFLGVASIMTLAVMAVVRFVSVNQQATRARISRRTVAMLCAGIWLYSLIWALFPVVGWGQYGPEPYGLSCSLAWAWMKEDSFPFVVTVFLFNLALPTLTIVCCYFAISLKLYLIYRQSSGSRIPKTVKMHQRLLVIAVLISAGFIVSWSPYGMVSLWYVLRDGTSLPPEVTMLPCMLAKTSTMYNPLIYYAFNRSFRREVRRLLCGPGAGVCCADAGVSHAADNKAPDDRASPASRENVRAVANFQLSDTRCHCPGTVDVEEGRSMELLF
ncbi:hypothetical protein NHX12_034502 [Muraenolepis orangiensis]|uniref:G-protein coupled receptors family 1 profile domain-containing protein n=1 Tax=Muraenolepis orangiensis TaxID=630683 RepID=A0A9Q0D7D0_9TELE|nr:hypothetical protein NHX12_034502 [Muraenolepis orangiensis]